MCQLFISVAVWIGKAGHVSICSRQTCLHHHRVCDYGHWNSQKEINFWSDWEVAHVQNHQNENIVCIELPIVHFILCYFAGKVQVNHDLN